VADARGQSVLSVLFPSFWVTEWPNGTPSHRPPDHIRVLCAMRFRPQASARCSAAEIHPSATTHVHATATVHATSANAAATVTSATTTTMATAATVTSASSTPMAMATATTASRHGIRCEKRRRYQYRGTARFMGAP